MGIEIEKIDIDLETAMAQVNSLIEALVQQLQLNLAQELGKLPTAVRNMTLKEFVTQYDGDVDVYNASLMRAKKSELDDWVAKTPGMKTRKRAQAKKGNAEIDTNAGTETNGTANGRVLRSAVKHGHDATSTSLSASASQLITPSARGNRSNARPLDTIRGVEPPDFVTPRNNRRKRRTDERPLTAIKAERSILKIDSALEALACISKGSFINDLDSDEKHAVTAKMQMLQSRLASMIEELKHQM